MVTAGGSFNINHFTNLTIQGPIGGGPASINVTAVACSASSVGVVPVIKLINFQNVYLRNLVITGGSGIIMQGSTLRADTLTVKGSKGDGITVASASTLNLQTAGGSGATPDTLLERKIFIQNNCGNGINITVGGVAFIGIDAEITGNGANGVVASGGTDGLNACCGGDIPGHILVSGNNFGIGANSGGLVTLNAGKNSTGSLSEILIQNNHHYGVNGLAASVIGMSGNVIVQNNFVLPIDPYLMSHPGGIFASTGAFLTIGNGVQVLNNQGAGIAGHLQAIIRLGNSPSPAGFPPPAYAPPSVANNLAGGLKLTGMSVAEAFGPSVNGNTGSDVSCDASSQILGDLSNVGKIQCVMK